MAYFVEPLAGVLGGAFDLGNGFTEVQQRIVAALSLTPELLALQSAYEEGSTASIVYHWASVGRVVKDLIRSEVANLPWYRSLSLSAILTVIDIQIGAIQFFASTQSFIETPRACKATMLATSWGLLGVVGGAGQHGVSGGILPTPVTVRLMNFATNHGAIGFDVSFETADGGRFLDAPSSTGQVVRTVKTDGNGYARVYWLLGAKTGNQVAIVRAPWMRGSPLSITASVKGPVAVPGSPTATTLAATNMTQNSVRLNGSVNPNGVSTSGYFEWGTSSTLSTFTTSPSFSAGAGTSAVPMPPLDISNLSCGVTYYFRAVARNANGVTVKGTVLSATLSACTVTAPAPTISAVTPNPVTGSASAITFTVTGTNFVQGTRVQVAYASTNYTFVDTNTNATFVSGTTLTVPIITTTQPDTWRVRVRNPDGQTSSTFVNLVVNAPAAPAPTLNQVLTNPTTAVAGQQFSFTLTGSNFNTATAQVLITGPNCSPCTISNSALTTKTATTLVGATILAAAGNYAFAVQNGAGGATSSSVSITVAAASTVPVIQQVTTNPTSPTAGQSFTFTVDGTGFDPATAQIVIVGTAACTTPTACVVPNGALTTKTSTRLAGVATISTAGLYFLTVQNGPTGGLSNGAPSSGLTVVSPVAPAPTISAVTPNPVTGSASAITFTVTGTNFVQGTRVQVAYASTNYTFVDTNTNATFVSGTTLTVPIITTTQPDTWRVRVRNPDGQTSSTFVNLVVNAPAAPAPTITSVSPASPIGSTSAQPFTINGNTFASGAAVTLRNVTTNTTYSNRTISSFSSTRIVINPVFGTQAHTWTVQVINPGNLGSNVWTFQVRSP
jgi:hypothetical protein